MGECRDCRWWDPTDAPQLGVPAPPTVGACRLLEMGQLRVATETRAMTFGALPSETRFLPWADFGCVQFAPREGTVPCGPTEAST